MDLILGLVFSFKMEKHVILRSRKGEEWLGEGGRRPPAAQLDSEVGGFWLWTVRKEFFFPPKIWTAVCTNSGLFCTVCVPFFPFMQSSSALAAEICLAEKASPRVASEGRWSCVFCLCIWTFEGDAPARGILKALSYLKSVYLQPFVSGITLH